MSRRVPADGPLNARLVVIAEAPAQVEEAQGRPLIGPSGQKWMGWLREVGLQRADCYIDNVYPYRAPKNQVALVPRAELAPWMDEVHARIAALVDPWVIVPMGNLALEALLGFKSIAKHRGSIYEYVDRRGRRIKCIPTIHPAAVFRQPGWERRCRTDWARIAGDLAFRERRVPEREHHIKPTLGEVADFVEDARQHAEVLAIDIETPRERQVVTTEGRPKKDGTPGKIRQRTVYGTPRVVCVGLSYDPSFSLTVPTTEAYWGSQLDDVWGLLREAAMLPCAKALQNGHFDAYYLALDHDVPLRRWTWDTRWMHHCVDPLDDHDLAYQASTLTRQPYWKDEAKDPDKISRYATGLDALWTYCGMDAAVTRELADTNATRLMMSGQMGFYHRFYAALYPIWHAFATRGIRLDVRAQKRLHAQLGAECLAIQDKLTVIAGEPLYGKKDLSTMKLGKFLYETLRLPRQFDRATGRVTTKEVTVRRLMLKHPAKLGRDDEPEMPGRLILDHRRKAKLASFVKEGIADADGYVRSQYGFTETGRPTSGKNPKRTGQNLLNVDREIRRLYLPDPGHIFLECDMSQAEDRIVKCLTGEPALIARARMQPWENDEHKRAASAIFRVALDQVTPAQRYMGKRVRHACVTPETEVLTRDGWVRIDALYADVEIAQWAESGDIRFVTPLQQIYMCDGTLDVWRAQAFSQIVTEDHRMPYMTNGTIKVTTSTGLRRVSSAKLPICGSYEGGTVGNEWFARLAVAIQADGHITHRKAWDVIDFHLKKPRKIQRLHALLDVLGIEHKTAQGRDKSTRITFRSPAGLGTYLTDKHWTASLLSMRKGVLESILDEIPHWDGYVGKTCVRYFTKSRSNAEWIKTIAHLCRRQALVRERSRVFMVSLNRRRYARRPTPRTVPYRGPIYCCTVPSGMFLIRHNGEISVTGNSNYGMHGKTLADSMLRDGVILAPEEAEAYLTALHQADPAVRDVFQVEIRKRVMNQRLLANSWGRMIDFTYERLNDDLYRQAYAWIPQSEVPDLVNQYALIPLDALIRKGKMQARVVQQIYDALLISTPPEEAWDLAAWLKGALERPRTYWGVELTIPVEFKVGRSWQAEREWKRFPDRTTFDTAVQEMLADGPAPRPR